MIWKLIFNMEPFANFPVQIHNRKIGDSNRITAMIYVIYVS